MTGTISTGLMLATLAVAMVTDLRSGKIRNWLTAPAVAAGLALGAIGGGLPAVGDRVLGAVVVLAAVAVLARVSHLGGGDIKLLVAVAALQGFRFALWTLLLAGVFGGLLAAAVMLRRRAVKATMVGMFTAMLSNAGGVPTDLASGSVGGRIPYSIAITLGLGMLGR